MKHARASVIRRIEHEYQALDKIVKRLEAATKGRAAR